MRWVVAGLGVVALVAFAACGGHGAGRTAPTTAAPTTAALRPEAGAARDVTVTTCAPDRDGHVVVGGTDHNPTARGVTDNIQVSILDAAGTRRFATAASATAAPGVTARWRAVTQAPYRNGTRCVVTGVARS